MSREVSRRSLLRGALAAGGLYGLDALFTCERTNAAAVGPNDNIKVTKIETFVLKNSWVFVKISTDAGITGWGEMLKDDAKACAAGALEVADYLIGQDPNRVVFHWQAIHRGSFYRGGPIKTAISSGIDQALWDIKGKVYGVPVYKLLGGPTRDRIRVYGQVSQTTGVNAMKVGPTASRAAVQVRRRPEVRRRSGGAIQGAARPRGFRRRYRHRFSRRGGAAHGLAADQGAGAVPSLVLRGSGAAAQRGCDGRTCRRRPTSRSPPASASSPSGASGRFSRRRRP